MKPPESAREVADHYTPGERRDRRRARSDWQRQQYRVAESESSSSEEANPQDPEAEGA